MSTTSISSISDNYHEVILLTENIDLTHTSPRINKGGYIVLILDKQQITKWLRWLQRIKMTIQTILTWIKLIGRGRVHSRSLVIIARRLNGPIHITKAAIKTTFNTIVSRPMRTIPTVLFKIIETYGGHMALIGVNQQRYRWITYGNEPIPEAEVDYIVQPQQY